MSHQQFPATRRSCLAATPIPFTRHHVSSRETLSNGYDLTPPYPPW
jgi:hypothetical protein